jgi:hypothetical protein
VDVKEDDGFVTVPCYAVRRRGKNEIEGWASLFSLSLSQSFFKLGPMSFSFLNAGALFYKLTSLFFFFFQFSGGLKRRLTSLQGWAGHVTFPRYNKSHSHK